MAETTNKLDELQLATTLEDVMDVFDPNRAMDPQSKLYIPREDVGLRKLSTKLKTTKYRLHAFLCGHRGSGKTTELKRLISDPGITDRYQTVYLTTAAFGDDPVHLTHDALLVEIGLKLIEYGKSPGMNPKLEDELEAWGQEIVKTYLHDEAALAEAGAGAKTWIAFFKAQLKTRYEWKTQEKQILEPKVQDLIDIVNRMAQDLKNRGGKELLVVVDDLEKGESSVHKDMHLRLFQEYYETLTQPRFSIIYTLPVYFRALPGRRVPSDQLFAFPALRLYKKEEKTRDRPPLSKDLNGYRVMRRFIAQRLGDPAILGDDQLDELLLIGGGLFRETARAVSEAAFFAHLRGGSRIEKEDVENVFHEIKKGFQPLIRGDAVDILKAVLESKEGWVTGVEPFLQSHAVVEYENHDLWLDLRYVLKPYVRRLTRDDG